MGLEVEALYYGSPMVPEELLTAQTLEFEQHQRWVVQQNTVRVKAKSMNEEIRRKKRPSSSGMKKSLSDKPLGLHTSLPPLSQTNTASASLQSGLAEENNQEENADELGSERRQSIMKRADEIMHGKRQIGVRVGEQCPVCLTDDVDTQLSTCGHLVHAKCIKRLVQSGSKCPVCRESVTGIEEAFPSPTVWEPMEKDVTDFCSSDDATTSPEQPSAFEWGWFEDFEDFDEEEDDDSFGKTASRFRCHSNASMYKSNQGSSRATSPRMNRELSMTFEVCRTFPPLRLAYDIPYSESKHVWMHGLPSNRHIAAKIQIRTFRIVESKSSNNQHAEYLIELHLDGRYFKRWRRFSQLSKFAYSLPSSQFRQALSSWNNLEASSRWFNRLELSYLHRRCRQIEEFAHALLFECTDAHPLADLLDG
ncbi:hypothetical protein Poli38472_014330 [Pythium oligandrum]|uniref:RING-type domain-containing protein n=1 Tax=Pythium oligandrum TaxID=41045 RepID=A0A8K1C716_PYTOL|nr:hypothetical protein Poli38472_014330 [Pythium oligandrum]|eukprot:TMW57727.1 hypothetical protein Poli38472_014330 [Pythium oligandrum]